MPRQKAVTTQTEDDDSKTTEKSATGRTNGGSGGKSQKTDAVSLLKDDHRNVEALFAKFEKCESSSEKEQIARKICQELITHTSLEEEIFYPACREKGVESKTLDEAQVEHDGAKVMINELLSSSADDDFYDAKVTVLKEYIKHHVGEEEKARGGIFAQAKKAGLDMDALGQRLQARKEQLSGKAEGKQDGKALSPPQYRALHLQQPQGSENRTMNRQQGGRYGSQGQGSQGQGSQGQGSQGYGSQGSDYGAQTSGYGARNRGDSRFSRDDSDRYGRQQSQSGQSGYGQSGQGNYGQDDYEQGGFSQRGSQYDDDSAQYGSRYSRSTGNQQQRNQQQGNRQQGNRQQSAESNWRDRGQSAYGSGYGSSSNYGSSYGEEEDDRYSSGRQTTGAQYGGGQYGGSTYGGSEDDQPYYNRSQGETNRGQSGRRDWEEQGSYGGARDRDEDDYNRSSQRGTSGYGSSYDQDSYNQDRDSRESTRGSRARGWSEDEDTDRARSSGRSWNDR